MLKKIILWTLLIFLLISGGLIIYVYHNQDFLKKQVITAVNERLKVPVDVKNITISTLAAFPDATVQFHNVLIKDPNQKDTIFAEAQKIGFSFNIWQLLKGEMVLEEVLLKDASVNIINYGEDQWSYEIYNEINSSENKSISFNIKKIKIENAIVVYESKPDKVTWSGTINDAIASIQLEGPITWVNINSAVASDYLVVKEYKTLVDQEISLISEIVTDKHWRIATEKLAIGDSDFLLKASKNEDQILVDFNALDANIKTFLDLAPHQLKKNFSNYNSSGTMILETSWAYSFSTEQTSMNGKLEFKDANINQQEPQININDLSLIGNITIPELDKLNSARLAIQDVKGAINNKLFEASLNLTNFSEPVIALDFEGEMPLALMSDLGNLELENPSGILQINLSVEGAIADMKKAEQLKKIKASGELILAAIYFELPNRSFALEVPRGNAIFNSDHLALNDFTLNLGESHFNINGQLKNFWNIASENPWAASATIYSSNLNLDQLLSVQTKNASVKNYQYNVPKNITLQLDAQIDALTARQFKAKRISGNISVGESRLKAEKLSFESMGGVVKLQGEWRDLNNSGSLIDASFLLSGIEAKELFYSFENFGQDFISDKNLSGKIYAEAETSLRLDTNLAFQPSSLIATLNTKIIEGKLTDFEPLYHLEKYFNDADLSEVKFAELENQIYIQDETVHLPMMPVGTNIVKFKIGGTHTFSQHIDYDVVAPLIRNKKQDKDTRFGEVEEDKHGESLLFLSIIGTTEDFEVTVDKKAIQQEIASDVKKELKELQDAFNKKETPSKEVELDEDAYFDWEEEEN